MRSRTWITLVFIILLAIFATWVALPGSNYDINGFRAAHPVREGLDLQGGLQVVLQANPVAGQTLDAETLEGTRQTLERRINALGVSEPLYPNARKRPDHCRTARHPKSGGCHRDHAADRPA
ncbi:MAG: hypothetical protein R2853_17535 [Thermomicrobiales bacterium]